MARFGQINDLYFTDAGDFVLGANGDLEDTKLHAYRGFIQRVKTRMMSKRGEWILQPGVGADLSEFAGQPNTRETGDRIKSRVITELTWDGLLQSQELIVDVIPVDDRQIAIIIFMTPPQSENNLILNFTYDLRDNRLVPRNP